MARMEDRPGTPLTAFTQSLHVRATEISHLTSEHLLLSPTRDDLWKRTSTSSGAPEGPVWAFVDMYGTSAGTGLPFYFPQMYKRVKGFARVCTSIAAWCRKPSL